MNPIRIIYYWPHALIVISVVGIAYMWISAYHYRFPRPFAAEGKGNPK